MNEKEIIQILNNCWDENGFFEKLRYNNELDLNSGQNLLKSLKKFVIKEDINQINRELVRLLWYAPQFMDWQEERLIENISENEFKTYQSLSGKLSQEIERILGYP